VFAFASLSRITSLYTCTPAHLSEVCCPMFSIFS
jgi:hypothetical protein